MRRNGVKRERNQDMDMISNSAVVVPESTRPREPLPSVTVNDLCRPSRGLNSASSDCREVRASWRKPTFLLPSRHGRVSTSDAAKCLTDSNAEINLTDLQKSLDTTALELVENQKENQVGRKKLAEQTRGQKLAL